MITVVLTRYRRLVVHPKIFPTLAIFFMLRAKAFSQDSPADTLRFGGSIAATGLVQTGDENRTVFSLLSVLKAGNRQYEFEPLTSIAYSTKPGKLVEGEYLENVILRYHQLKRVYPAMGLAIERSFLRKIGFRSTVSAIIVCNIVNAKDQKVKLGAGYSHEYAEYARGAFVPQTDAGVKFSRSIEQLYARVKGEHAIERMKLSYDLFYQVSMKDFADSRWIIIANADYAISKRLDIRISAITSYEEFIAPNVSHDNFRMTYGININL